MAENKRKMISIDILKTVDLVEVALPSLTYQHLKFQDGLVVWGAERSSRWPETPTVHGFLHHT